MNRTIFMLQCVLLAGCGAADSGSQASSEKAEPAMMAHSALEGREAYVAACARCHDSGESGAPVTGKPADWSGRSQLWQAVLAQHVKAGYLEMPARGGQPGLSDRAIEIAIDYMLSATFPERPPD